MMRQPHKPKQPNPAPQIPALVTSPGRRKRRRRLLWWSALPALLVLCLSAKLLSMGMLADTAARSFAAGDSAGVADAAAGLRIANFIEPYRAPFADGDGLFLAGDFAAARQRFEEALSLAGTADECVVRVNLALTIERLGDAQAKAEDPTAAARLFAEGVAVVDAAPEGCFDAGGEAGADAGTEAGAGEKLKQAGERLQQKADAAAGEDTAPKKGTIQLPIRARRASSSSSRTAPRKPSASGTPGRSGTSISGTKTSGRALTGPGSRPRPRQAQYARMIPWPHTANKILHGNETRRKTAS